MKVVVDRGLCKGHGVCMAEAPRVFEVSRAGKLSVLEESPGEEERAKVMAAVKYCPTGALSVEG
jgi:ferredoxin